MNPINCTASCVIVVPVYRGCFSESERLSLLQCFKVFCSRPVVFVAPEGLDISAYAALAGEKAVEAVYYPAEYFTSIESYSRLLMSGLFYQRFKQFEYMLIYQTDAWAFQDDLDYWCGQGYDYTGAPWVTKNADGSLSPAGAWNGGFCLRRISAFLSFFEKRGRALFSREELIRLHYAGALRRGGVAARLKIALMLLAKRTGFRNSIDHYARHYTEDDFWCGIVPKTGVALRLAPYEAARRFAFEVYPDVLFALNEFRLPFGCHAWQRYNPGFWAAYIPSEEGSAGATQDASVK